VIFGWDGRRLTGGVVRVTGQRARPACRCCRMAVGLDPFKITESVGSPCIFRREVHGDLTLLATLYDDTVD